MQRKTLAALLASAVMAMPIAANAGAVAARSSQPVAGGMDLTANSDLFFILGVAAVAAGIILLQEDEEGVPISA